VQGEGYNLGTDIDEVDIVNVGRQETVYAAVVTFANEPMAPQEGP